MTDALIFAVGCGVTFMFSAGAYIVLRSSTTFQKPAPIPHQTPATAPAYRKVN